MIHTHISNHLILLALVLFISCTSCKEKQVVKFTNFPEKHKLYGTEINLQNPHRIQMITITDSMIFLMERPTPNSPAISAYYFPTMQFKESFAYTGKGAGELLTPIYCTADNDSRYLWVYDINKRMLGGYPTTFELQDEKKTYQEQIVLPFHDIEMVYNVNVYSKSKYALYKPDINGGIFQLYVNDSCVKSIGYLDIKQSDIPPLAVKQIYSGRSEYNFTTNKMAVFYSYTDLLQIVDMENNSVRTIQGPDLFDPTYQIVGGAFAATRNTKFAYVQTASDDQYIYALYCGENYSPMEKSASQGAQFLNVFDWNGNPTCCYELHPPCLSFAIDSKNKKMYACSGETDNLLVYDLMHMSQRNIDTPAESDMNIKTAQDSFVCKGVVLDSKTQKTLPYTHIYPNGDTISEMSNEKGEFQLQVKSGTKLQFHKSGYLWQSFRMKDRKEILKIELTPSVPLTWMKILDKQKEDSVQIVFDGKFIPKEEWNDLNQKEVHRITSQKLQGGYLRLIMVSKE